MSRSVDLTVGDYVSIYEDIIDRKVAGLLNENKNRSAARWDSYRNVAFRIIYFDKENLAVLEDAHGNEIHISKRALYIVQFKT